MLCTYLSWSNIRQNDSSHYDANHLLSPANWPLLRQRVTNRAPFMIFSGKVATDTQFTANAMAYISRPYAQSSLCYCIRAMDNDLTNIYVHENIWDYDFNIGIY